MRGTYQNSAEVPDWRELLGGKIVTDPMTRIAYDLDNYELADTYKDGSFSYHFREGVETTELGELVRIFLPERKMRIYLYLKPRDLWRGQRQQRFSQVDAEQADVGMRMFASQAGMAVRNLA